MLHFFKILTDIVVEEPQTLGWLSELLNSTWTWVTTLGAGAITGIVALARTLVPSNTALLNLRDKIDELKEGVQLDALKIDELETAQKEYQQANDELLTELALLSPNAKAKELAKKLEEKKKALSIQEQIATKVNEAVKSVEAKAVSILKKKE
jgi:hypothetical protein